MRKTPGGSFYRDESVLLSGFVVVYCPIVRLTLMGEKEAKLFLRAALRFRLVAPPCQGGPRDECEGAVADEL